MGNFWNIVGFEFKKIVMKKGTILTILLALCITLFTCLVYIIGDFYDTKAKFGESQLEFTQKEIGYLKDLTGRPIDSELLLETVQAYKNIPTTAEQYTETEEYELYARSYSQIFCTMSSVYSTPSKIFEWTDAQNVTQGQVDAFYAIRYQKILGAAEPLNQKSKDKLIALNAQIEIPIIFEYTGGYTRFIVQMFMTGVITSLAMILSTLLTGVTYCSFMLIYGSDGATAPFQVLFITCIYPLNMEQVAFIFFISVLFANILIASITMLLSAQLKSSFSVIIILFILVIAPIFIHVPETNVFLYNLLNLLPSNMMDSNLVFPIFYEIFGLSIKPYIFMPSFAALLSIVLVPFAFKGFKNHQVV